MLAKWWNMLNLNTQFEVGLHRITRGENSGVCLHKVSEAGIHHHRPPDFSSHLTRHISGMVECSHEHPGKPSAFSIWTVVYRNGSSLLPLLDAGQAPSLHAPLQRLASTIEHGFNLTTSRTGNGSNCYFCTAISRAWKQAGVLMCPV